MEIEDAIKIVNTWPEWKKHLLENSLKSECPRREPIEKNKQKENKSMNNQDHIKTRPSWDHTFMTMAYEIAKRSHDCQTQHGSIIVKDNKILASGYNGFIRGIDDSKLPNTRPEKYPWMIHSEINALLNCEHRPVGATIYVTGHPCLHCYQCLYQAGISTIIYDARPERNAVMIDDEMMANIKILEDLLGGRIMKIPYIYETKMEEAFRLGKEALEKDEFVPFHDNIPLRKLNIINKIYMDPT